MNNMKRYKSKDRRNKGGLSWVGNDRENILIRMCEIIDKKTIDPEEIPKLNKEVTKENEN
jgi:hypothetical protein